MFFLSQVNLSTLVWLPLQNEQILLIIKDMNKIKYVITFGNTAMCMHKDFMCII